MTKALSIILLIAVIGGGICFSKNYINENMQSDLDPQKICVAVGVSRSVLYLKFKAITGQGIQEFIKSVRLKNVFMVS